MLRIQARIAFQVKFRWIVRWMIFLEHYTVLVAHNGFKFDFPTLFAEIDRRKEHFDTSLLCDHNIHFADTLILLQKVEVYIPNQIIQSKYRKGKMAVKLWKGSNS